MQFALVNGERKTPQKGKSGICPGCGKEVVAKCGAIKVHHWAHKQEKDCDPWWESETEWHRQWKNHFPENYREVTFHDPATGEIHRADVHTPSGITIEFQNSSISISELESRNKFYQDLVWVVNAGRFKGFQFTCAIPDPESPLLQEFEFFPSKHPVLYRKSDFGKEGSTMMQIFSLNSPELNHIPPSPIHWLYEWKHPHAGWFRSAAPVYFDFGHEFLYLLKMREQLARPFYYFHILNKKEFIAKHTPAFD